MRKVIRFYAVAGCVLAGFAVADPLPAQQEMLSAIQSGTQPEVSRQLCKEISRTLNDQLSLSEEDVSRLGVSADCIRFAKLISTNAVDEQTVEWILTSEDRLHRFVETVLPTDCLTNCFEVLTTLSTHDPDGRGRWFDLMLAISVVWDVSKRPLIHDQEGKKLLSYKPEITARYDYFTNLYSGADAKIPYSSLSAKDLVFVVDAPIPLSELEWARQNEKGSAAAWGRKFHAIEYDHDRLDTRDYDWPWGLYTLADIKERGGICVDQAYYAVITARAFGIPVIWFHARGRDSNHAWFSHMTAPGHWALNVGRWKEEEYTTGLAINPQTNEDMTDHDVTYMCEETLRSADFPDADRYAAIAEVLLESDPRNARRCAQAARQLVPLYSRPWKIEADALIAEKEYDDLADLVSEQVRVFSGYPDIAVAAADRAESILAKAGRTEDALHLRRSLSRKVNDGRDDLHRFLGQEEIDRLVEKGDIKKARRQMEKLLKDHIADGAKAIELVDHYVTIMKDTSEMKSAAGFLEKYTEEFERENGSNYKPVLLSRLLKAYKNAGDEKGIQKTGLRLNCY